MRPPPDEKRRPGGGGVGLGRRNHRLGSDSTVGDSLQALLDPATFPILALHHGFPLEWSGAHG